MRVIMENKQLVCEVRAPEDRNTQLPERLQTEEDRAAECDRPAQSAQRESTVLAASCASPES
jgi:cell division septum initiation protein DivIVA